MRGLQEALARTEFAVDFRGLRCRRATRAGRHIFRVGCFVLVVTLATVPFRSVAQPSPQAKLRSAKPHQVLATVNGAEILAAEVTARWNQLPASRQRDPQSTKRTLLELLIRQQLVLDYLQRRSLGASDDEINLALSRWQKQLASLGSTPEAYYRNSGLDAAAVRRRLAWEIAWPRYLDRKLTDDRLQAYFQDHRRDFDGTRLRVAHILWLFDEDRPAQLATAEKVRAACLQGELTFSAAAAKNSEAPSAEQGGEIGWIERRHPMDSIFSEMAFQLETGEISQPFSSLFGVHLVKCLQVEEGKKSFAEVRAEVETAARNAVFRTLAERQRKSAELKMWDEPE